MKSCYSVSDCEHEVGTKECFGCTMYRIPNIYAPASSKHQDHIPPADKANQELKQDNGKPRWDLLPFNCIEGIVNVLTFGAKKYEDNGWKDLMADQDGENRVRASLLRHYSALAEEGIDAIDAESGLPHVDHLACNVLFLKYRQLLAEKANAHRGLTLADVCYSQAGQFNLDNRCINNHCTVRQSADDRVGCCTTQECSIREV